MTALNHIVRFFTWRSVAVLALVAALAAGGARIALGSDSPSEDAVRKESYVAQDLNAADDDDDQDDDQSQTASRSGGDGDDTRGNDGTNGGNNTGENTNTNTHDTDD